MSIVFGDRRADPGEDFNLGLSTNKLAEMRCEHEVYLAKVPPQELDRQWDDDPLREFIAKNRLANPKGGK